MLVNGHPGLNAMHPGQQVACVAPTWSAPGNDSSWILNLSYPLGTQFCTTSARDCHTIIPHFQANDSCHLQVWIYLEP